MRQSKGFTLIEVLIAGSIMFIVLVMVTDSFITARQSARHANNVIAMLAPVPLFKADIKRQLQQAPAQNGSGQSTLGEVSVQWHSEIVAQKAPTPKFELEAGTTTHYNTRFYLHQVDMTLTIASQHKQLSYQELVWLPQVGVAQ